MKQVSTNIQVYLQGKLEHHCVKWFYGLTNKNNYRLQIARHQQQQALLLGIKQHEEDFKRAAEATESPDDHSEVSLGFTDNEPLSFTSPKYHHHSVAATQLVNSQLQ